MSSDRTNQVCCWPRRPKCGEIFLSFGHHRTTTLRQTTRLYFPSRETFRRVTRGTFKLRISPRILSIPVLMFTISTVQMLTRRTHLGMHLTLTSPRNPHQSWEMATVPSHIGLSLLLKRGGQRMLHSNSKRHPFQKRRIQ